MDPVRRCHPTTSLLVFLTLGAIIWGAVQSTSCVAYEMEEKSIAPLLRQCSAELREALAGGDAGSVPALAEKMRLQVTATGQAADEVRGLFFRVLCHFLEGEDNLGRQLAVSRLLPMCIQSHSGYMVPAMKWSHPPSPDQKILLEWCSGKAEVEIIPIIDGKETVAGIVAKSVNTGISYDVTCGVPNESDNRRPLKVLLPPGRYIFRATVGGKTYQGGEIELADWESYSIKQEFQPPKELKELRITFPAPDANFPTGQKLPAFTWEWDLEPGESFRVELCRVLNDIEKFRLWGPYETKDRTAIFNEDGKAFDTLGDGFYELSVTVVNHANPEAPRLSQCTKFTIGDAGPP